MKMFAKTRKIVHLFEGAQALAGALTPGVLPVWRIEKKILRKHSGVEATRQASNLRS